MTSAEKRQRKKENTRRAREEREREVQRARRRKRVVRVGVIAAIAVGVFALFTVTRGGDSEEADPVEPDPVAVEYPEGCTGDAPDRPDVTEAFDGPEDVLEPGTAYRAVIETTCGTIVAALDTENAPTGANNFAFLANERFFDGLTFHRVVDGFVIQGGDPDGDGTGGPGYQVQTETPEAGYATGDLAWAKAGPDPNGTAGSQFFVVSGERIDALNAETEDGFQYGRFGEVTEGLEVAQRIESLHEGDGPPQLPVWIVSVTVEPT